MAQPVNIEKLYQAFKSKVDECTVRPKIIGADTIPNVWPLQDFVLKSQLRAWLKSPTTDTAELGYPTTTICEELLTAAYAPRALPYEEISIREIFHPQSRGCTFTFCILLELRVGALIHEFREKHITDSKLPMQLPMLERRIHDVLESSKSYQASLTHKWDAKDLARDFERLQWKYSAEKLPFNDSETIHGALPVAQMQLITDKGGFSSSVFEIAVPEEYVHGDLTKVEQYKLQAWQQPGANGETPVCHWTTLDQRVQRFCFISLTLYSRSTVSLSRSLLRM